MSWERLKWKITEKNYLLQEEVQQVIQELIAAQNKISQYEQIIKSNIFNRDQQLSKSNNEFQAASDKVKCLKDKAGMFEVIV